MPDDFTTLIPGILELRFVENPGMAFGWMLPGDAGKIALTVFRLIAIGAIGWYLNSLIKDKVHGGLIICVALILSGALGNIIDSAIYGQLFSVTNHEVATIFPADGGYAPFLMGHVVDMFHFTVTYPDWFPWVDSNTEIFPPIFNIADAAISFGVIIILLRQKTFFKSVKEKDELKTEASSEA